MTRLLTTFGDRLLTMVAPRAEAAADPTYLQCQCWDCVLWQRVCGPSGCGNWYPIGQCYVDCYIERPWTC
ncbi:hypothetical protein Skr01_35990 [Sphaerisporangium krabiense]|uniref:Uncharacterized protein n=1 Tax=Sphaerisporangium krabiense TaxID=763782 RepID=A0A7W8Z3Y1_9ACTN|nr:hypothetical protein [Sphaerisporangium krabiense]MBB5626593.1 hypothetical protein [Sphaerisporangium krabiense]GII63514.1 hypothetical protein Skr01_35990 [Sphaerisporangium krabiense]